METYQIYMALVLLFEGLGRFDRWMKRERGFYCARCDCYSVEANPKGIDVLSNGMTPTSILQTYEVMCPKCHGTHEALVPISLPQSGVPY